MEREKLSRALNRKEQFYLKLLAHNYSIFEMSSFLELKKKDLNLLNTRVKERLDTRMCYDTIVKAFELKIIDEYDFVPEIVKKEALKTVSVILQFQQDEKEINEVIIKGLLKKMMKESEEQLLAQNLQETRIKELSDMEIKYLKYSFEGKNNECISEELGISLNGLLILEMEIFKKLRVNGWYNAYRRAFGCGLFEKEKDKKYYVQEFEKAIKSIMGHYNLIKRRGKIEVEIIYRDLVSLYSAIEYKTLHKNYHAPKIMTTYKKL